MSKSMEQIDPHTNAHLCLAMLYSQDRIALQLLTYLLNHAFLELLFWTPCALVIVAVCLGYDIAVA